MDIKLPDANGWELTKKIHGIPKYGNVPIIAQTAYAMGEDVEKSLEAGCNDHISKPIDAHVLTEKIRKLIS